MTEYSRLKTSPSAAIRATLDYPVIDTDVHTNDFTPALEDYIANYGGAKLVDALRKAESSRLNSKSDGKDWYQQTPEERQYNRTIPFRVNRKCSQHPDSSKATLSCLDG